MIVIYADEPEKRKNFVIIEKFPQKIVVQIQIKANLIQFEEDNEYIF